jgi:membrane-bound lytic murein transglycosylase MltF
MPVQIPIMITLAALLFAQLAFGAEPPRASLQYRDDLTRQARLVWGLDAPIATMAAQIHQESAWRPDVCSAFACGLTQFTGPTAEWIGGAYRAELGTADVMNPAWAIRALVRYDRHIWDRIPDTASDCDHWAMVLSGYNGGPGFLNRDRRLAASRGADPMRWFGHVELHSARAAWAFKENRGYPRNILLRWQPIYAGWGPLVTCGSVG